MNERLEKDVKECWDYVFALGWDNNSLMTMNHTEFTAFAQHFYNLALEDVRKEVEDRMTGKSFAIKMELLDIGAFIENLTR